MEGWFRRHSPLNAALCVKESMTKFINLFLCLLSLNCLAAEPIKEWNELNEMYARQMENGLYLEAVDTSLKLNNLEPTDTTVLLYIVYSHTKAGLSVPIWVLAEPWPNKSVKDRMNRLIAESIGSNT